MKPVIEQIKAARRVGVPLIAISTPDPAALIESLRGTVSDVPLVQWDCCNGWLPLSKSGAQAIIDTLAGGDAATLTTNATESLMMASQLPARSILILHGAHRLLRSESRTESVVQAVWNLRDQFKANNRALLALGPSFTLPAEIANDFLVLDDPLPDAEAVQAITEEIARAASLTIDPAQLSAIVDAARGLSAFAVEQSVCLAASKAGIDPQTVWQRKRVTIEQTPGLTVWRGRETFNQVGGNAQIKQFMRLLLKGRQAPRVVVFIDEIEKAMAGAQGDTSGVSQAFLGALLTHMQDKGSIGSIFVGPPGAGKSAIAKAVGGEGGIPTIALDLSGMKASLVGESEERLRNALKVISSIGDDQTLFIATCNRLAGLPPELRRRFTLGTWFFDLPDAEERAAIWQIYQRAYGLPDTMRASDVEAEGWTGAEIRQCCDLQYRLDITASEAARFIVPVARSAAKEIEELRLQADRRFLSASHPGVYDYSARAASAANYSRTTARTFAE